MYQNSKYSKYLPMTFFRNHTHIIFAYEILGSGLTVVSNNKNLGISFVHELWHSYWFNYWGIGHVILGFIRRICSNVTQLALYYSFFRAILEYIAILQDPLPANDIFRIKRFLSTYIFNFSGFILKIGHRHHDSAPILSTNLLVWVS